MVGEDISIFKMFLVFNDSFILYDIIKDLLGRAKT